MAQPPKLTHEQRQAALAKAAEVRRRQAGVKEKLKAGELTFAQVVQLGASDEMIDRIKVLAVLESLPGVGKVKARRLMEEIGISHSRRLRGLGHKQKATLLERLG